MSECPCPHHPIGCHGHPTKCRCATHRLPADMTQRAGEMAHIHDPPPLLTHGIAFMQECMAAHGLPDIDSVAAERMLATIVKQQSALEVAQQQVTDLERRYADGLAAWRANNACHAGAIARMSAKLKELAGTCAECGGTGVAPPEGIERAPCPACKDIRDAAEAMNEKVGR